MALIPGWVRVVCEHGTVTRFVVNKEGRWLSHESDAERVGDRWRWPMRCGRCGLSVPVAHSDLLGPVLDRLVRVDNPAVKRVSPIAIEVSLKLLADAVGASRTLPE